MSTQIIQNAKLWFDGYDLSGDMNSLSLSYGAELQDATVLGDASRRRRAGLKTVSFSHIGFWNGGAGGVDDALFSEIGVNDVPMTIAPLTGVEGELAYLFNAEAASYAPGGQVGQMFKFTVTGETSDGRGLVRGTIGRRATDTVTANGTIMNLGAVGSTQKLYAALHVFDTVAGSSPTLDVKIQSAALVGFGSPTDRITFTQKTAKGSQYATPVAGAITDAYWRVAVTIGGTGGPSFPLAVVIGIQ